jgi:hypothetical protein
MHTKYLPIILFLGRGLVLTLASLSISLVAFKDSQTNQILLRTIAIDIPSFLLLECLHSPVSKVEGVELGVVGRKLESHFLLSKGEICQCWDDEITALAVFLLHP